MQKFFKTLSIASLFLLGTNVAFAAISSSPVHQAICNGGLNSSFSCTITAPANGNTEIIADVGNNAATTITSVTYTGNTCTKGLSNDVGRQASLWYCSNVQSGGTSMTINLSGSPTISNDLNISEWSGLANSSVFDASNPANSGASCADTGAITPTAGRNILVISTLRAGGAVTAGPAVGWTALTSPDSSSRAFMAYQVISSSSGTYSNQYTCSGGFGSVIADFLAPSAPVVTTIPYPVLNLYQALFQLLNGILKI